MKRLYYLSKSLDTTERISSDLHDAGISDWNFHVLSQDQDGLYKRQIHSANLLQKTDLLHSLEKSLILGASIDLIAALVLSQIPIHGSTPSWGLLLAVFGGGLLAGGWYGTLFGVQNEHIKLKPFHNKLEQGYYLIMVDVSANQVASVCTLMEKLHPQAQFCAQESPMVVPFEQPKELTF